MRRIKLVVGLRPIHASRSEWRSVSVSIAVKVEGLGVELGEKWGVSNAKGTFFFWQKENIDVETRYLAYLKWI